jgi:mono/diheme cytochrome c family protein
MVQTQRWNRILAAGVFAVVLIDGGGSGRASAQDQVVLTSGKLEYQHYCATCHGANGTGNGPMADLLKTAPADLTQLSNKNRGQYPFWRVYRTIDGREEVMAHGTRAMPIWGAHFLIEEGGAPLDEHTVLGRILSLVYYIESLQGK